MRRNLVSLYVFFLIAFSAVPAAAHPLGNFTINHLAKVEIVQHRLNVRYFLDIAEIPTFQIMREHSGTASWGAAALEAWAASEVRRVERDLAVTIDGRPVALEGATTQARLRPGAGGLPILYWSATLSAPIAAGSHRVTVADRTYADRRIGWKDIVAGSESEPTQELLKYPSALIGSPRTITSASFAVAPSGAIFAVDRESSQASAETSTAPLVRQTLLSEMFLREDQGGAWILITILAAFAFGALHAIEPGHGKALLAFTLVGSRATTQQAALLAGSLTLAHTIGVVLLGIVLFSVTNFVPETIYPWITLVSGVAIAVVGARALARYFGAMRPHAHTHRHEHPHAHPHDHVHDHGFGAHVHGHEHAKAQKPLGFAGAVWAAMSGGIAPCPAAIVLLIAAVNAHRIAYGLLLIVIFGLGLASVLTGLGIAVVHGAAKLSSNKKFERIIVWGPLASAVLISLIGAVLLAQGFAQVGVQANVVLIAGLVIAAIVGYAFTGQHGHRHHAAEGV